MKYFLTDIKKIYTARIVRYMLILLLLVAILDPIYSYISLIGMPLEVLKDIGNHPFQYWLLLASAGIGFRIYHTLFFVLPVLSTAMMYHEEYSSSIYEWLIIRGNKRKYYLSKMFSIFITTFINFFIIFSINVGITYMIFSSNTPYRGQYGSSIPKLGMFSRPFYDNGEFSMIFLYIILNALAMALLALLAQAFHMIVKIRNKYLAILAPIVFMFLLDVILSRVYFPYMFYQLEFLVQPYATSFGTEIIPMSNVLIGYGSIFLIDIVALIVGYIMNRDKL